MVGWHHQFNGHKFEKLLELLKDSEALHSADHGVANSWAPLSN